MPRLSDIIEVFIKDLLESSKESQLQIGRNELANYFRCAPSQINYVLTTRFTTDKGYYIESKRGGGGCIIIKHVEFDENKSLANVINEKLGNSITYDSAANMIDGLIESTMITEREGNILKVVINDRTLSSIIDKKNKLRSEILKSVIMVILNES